AGGAVSLDRVRACPRGGVADAGLVARVERGAHDLGAARAGARLAGVGLGAGVAVVARDAVLLRKMAGHSGVAYVVRAGVAVVRGRVAAVGDAGDIADAVAHREEAVARHLRSDRGIRRGERGAADAGGAGARAALVVGAGAVGGHQALDARAHAIAKGTARHA